jgi:hypothetical protein
MPRHPPCALNILTVIKAGSRTIRPVIPVPPAGSSRSGWLWLLCSCQGPSERAMRARTGTRAGERPTHARFAGGQGPRSLKTQQHAPRSSSRDASRTRARFGRHARPHGRRPADQFARGLEGGGRRRTAPCRAGTGVVLPRKEVIQPHLPVRLPCYDFTPVTSPTFDGSLPRGVRPPASGVAHSRGVTGGVYKARERIHRGNADPRLLATPPSCRRVSACNPNRDAL